MCGIAGLSIADEHLIRQMIKSISHRGPDDFGEYIDDNVSLGNCRLNIVDLSSRGHQPMSNEKGTIWITFNGEIYNATALKKELEQLGHEFKSDSDTECIIHGYETWGTNVVRKLNGMWGFCIYDSEKQKLFLSRDRMGVKPLYYLATNGTFAFSSELKVFAVIESLRRPISMEGLSEQLMIGFNSSRRTILDSVSKLGPGESMIYDLRIKDYSVLRYWDNYCEKCGLVDVDHLNFLMDQSMALHLISDVPVGCYLSGGLDSSAIALKYSEMYAGSLHTFTVGFGNAEDEFEKGKSVANYLGTNHHELLVTGEMVANNFMTLLHFYDLSLTDGAFVPNYFISNLAKSYVTVTLAGEGGDEVFGGYSTYEFFSKAQRAVPFKRVRKVIAQSSLKLSSSQASYLLLLHKWGSKEFIYRGLYGLSHENDCWDFMYSYLAQSPIAGYPNLIRSANIGKPAADVVSDIDHMLELDQRFLLAENFNYKADRATSAASIEERVPFQEHNLVEYLNSLPNKVKFNEIQEKILLKKIVARFAPQIAKLKKQGYGTPNPAWMSKSLSPELENAVKLSKRLPMINQERVSKIYTKFKEGNADSMESKFLWNLLIIIGGLDHFKYI